MRSIRFYARRVYKEAVSLFGFFRDWKHLEINPPRSLNIELTNICNANCIFCGYQYDKRKKGIISQSLYSQVLSEYRQMGGTTVWFAPMVGEPLLDSNFVQRIKEAKSLGFSDICVQTNGILLHKYDPKELLNSGITLLIISTAPLEKERLEKIYRNYQYAELLKGLKQILFWNKKLNRPVTIEIAFRSDIPIKEVLCLPDYQKHIKPYIENERKEVRISKGYDSWGGMIKQEDLLGVMELASVSKYRKRPCIRTFEGLITWDGQLRACTCRFNSFDKEDSLIVGDLKQAGLGELWFGDKLKQLRRNFLENKICMTCRNCALYNSV